MHDFKNIFIAVVSSVSSVCTALEDKTVITIISAIVLPIVFFTIGKTADVCLQIYFRRLEGEPPACRKSDLHALPESAGLHTSNTGKPEARPPVKR